MKPLRVLASLGSLAWLGLCLQWFWGIRRVPVLREVRGPSGLEGYPALCVILAARDEERAVEESVESMLSGDYPGELEVIVVDDRSTDRTGEILEKLATKHPESLRVLRVESLPEGWLGKTHALHLGATQAAGEWLLFTDADVRFSPTCLERALRYATGEDLDHLTLPPEILCQGVLLRSFVAVFQLVFEVTQRPWRAADPHSRAHVGVGAFFLIRATAYRRIGTHRAIRMRPDDDMRLAKLVKDHRFRQRVAYGTGLVAVEWHETLRGAVRGLSKSMFPAVDYRVDATLAGVLALALTNVVPLFGLFTRGAARALSLSSVLSTLFLYAYRARHTGVEIPTWYAALHPFGICVFIYAMIRSAATTIVNGGIEWRGTRYPLDSLRENPTTLEETPLG